MQAGNIHTCSDLLFSASFSVDLLPTLSCWLVGRTFLALVDETFAFFILDLARSQ